MSLSLNNICIGNVFIKLSNCDSTNVFAKNLLSKSEPIEGAVIIADYQTQGKGQIGNAWQSAAEKNLTFSIILKPSFLKIEEQFMLSKIVSLACIETLKQFVNEDFLIKWPNDIYFEDKKIGGILIENLISNHKISDSILGVGLNINQEHFEMLPRAISLKNILYHDYDLNSLLATFLKKLDAYYLRLRQGNFEEINKSYLKNMLGFDEERVFNEKGKLFKGTVRGITSEGFLKIETENGYEKHFNFKEVAWHF